VHDEFKAFELDALKAAHPERPAAILALADAIGSTSGILKAAREMEATTFIVATDNDLMHKLRMLNPGKTFLEAPTAGNSATCKSCAHCPWMAMNSLQGLAAVLESGANQIQVDPLLGASARLPIDRMLAFTAELVSRRSAPASSGIVPHIGAA
jgi:quinolinate synthase